MRVLVVSTAGAGHVTPLVPIIGAFLAGGDEVVVASGPEAEPIVEKTGARFALAGRSEAEDATYGPERAAAIRGGAPLARFATVDHGYLTAATQEDAGA